MSNSLRQWLKKVKIPGMWIRVAAFFVTMLLVRRVEGEALRSLSDRQTEDLLQRLSADRQMPRWARLMAKAPWLYSRAPVDLIPDSIPFIGRIDDKLVTSFALTFIARLSPRARFDGHVDDVLLTKGKR